MPTDYSQVFNQQVAEDRQRKQTFSDEYRKKQIADYQGFAQHIQGILTSGQVLDKSTGNMRPLTDEEKGKLQSTAQTVNQYIQNLYNPQFDPSKGGMSEDPLHKLTDKLHLTKPPQQTTNIPSNPVGLKTPGNINLNNRPVLKNADGSVSTERSFSIGTDQGEVLIPRIFDGRDHTEQEAIQHYRQTGQHMGIFDTPEHANAYAQQVHNRFSGQAPQTMEQARQGIETQFGADTGAAQKRQESARDLEQMVSLAKKYGMDERAIQDMIEKRLGGVGITRAKDKWDLLQGKVNGKDVTWLKNSANGEVQTLAGDPVSAEDLNSFVPTPKGATGKVSQYDQQKAEFAKSLGKDVSQLTWEDEKKFLKQRQPYGDARLAISQAMLVIAKKNLELKESESDFKAYLQIQKQMAPLEKIQTAATNADYYVSNPSGPGDVGLVFAFIEATKPTSGFRFTDTERKWIIATRGLMEGIQTKIEGGFTGVTLSDDQRKTMTGIIKNAATQVKNQTAEIIGGAAEFKPKAAKAAAKEIGAGTKKKVSLKKAMALPQYKGKPESEVRKAIEDHGYEVAP